MTKRASCLHGCVRDLFAFQSTVPCAAFNAQQLRQRHCLLYRHKVKCARYSSAVGQLIMMWIPSGGFFSRVLPHTRAEASCRQLHCKSIEDFKISIMILQSSDNRGIGNPQLKRVRLFVVVWHLQQKRAALAGNLWISADSRNVVGF